MSKDYIEVRGAEEHNPRTSTSGSRAKSSPSSPGSPGRVSRRSRSTPSTPRDSAGTLSESLSAYARNFLGQMDKPQVESVEGLSPAISIDQKNAANNPRSTVGTVTELHDYLRLLYARIGTQYDPVTGEEVGEQSAQDMVNQILELPEGTRARSPRRSSRPERARSDLFEELVSDGYARVEVDGEPIDLTLDDPELDQNYDHTIDVIVDRVTVSPTPARGSQTLWRPP